MEPNQTNSQTEVPSSNPITPTETTTQSTSNKEATIDMSENTVMAALSYIGPLVLIPFMTKKDDPYVAFHIKQGLVLFAIEIALYLVGIFVPYTLYFMLAPFITLLNLGLLVLTIIGVINALQRKEKELPLVGKFSSNIKI